MFEFFLKFQGRENKHDIKNKPRFSHREVGFCCFGEAPRSPAGRDLPLRYDPVWRDFRFTLTICGVCRQRQIKKYYKFALVN